MPSQMQTAQGAGTSERSIWIYGNPDKSDDGFPSPGDLTQYIKKGVFRDENRRYRYTQGRNADVIVLSRDGLAYGHFEIENKVRPNRKDRKAYPPVKFVYLVRRSTLYNKPVPLSSLSIKGIRFGKKISESQFQTLQELAGGSKQYGNDPLPPPETPEAADLAEPSPERVATTTYRILRDTELARGVKVLHEFKCQVCGRTIELPDGSRYAEAHHIQPLGKPHDGPDVIGNILCLCPNHHAEFDLGASAITLSAIRCCEGHTISQKYVDYHNQRIHDAQEG